MVKEEVTDLDELLDIAAKYMVQERPDFYDFEKARAAIWDNMIDCKTNDLEYIGFTSFVLHYFKEENTFEFSRSIIAIYDYESKESDDPAGYNWL